jgi:site-specific DNA recombinase
MKNKQNRYILYARRSSDDNSTNQLLSIDSQIAVLKKLAATEDIHIVDTLTESRSAKELGRPVFADMLARIRRGEADGILVWKMDRLARNMPEGSQIIDMLQRGVIKHIRSYCDGNSYPDDNVMMLCMHFGMANQYSRDLAKNITRGLKTKCDMGWCPGRAPIGYSNSMSKTKGAESIVKDPERFDLVRKMWDMVLSGSMNSSQVLEIATNEWGLRSRYGNKMSRSNVYAMLTNPFYYGSYEYPKGSGNWYTGKHEPMVTEAEYEEVQYLLGRKNRPRSQKSGLTFLGTMACGECGMSITGEDKKKTQKNGNVHMYSYYHCSKHSNKPCGQGSVEEKQLIEQIDAELTALEIPEAFHQWSMKWIKVELQKDTEAHASIIESQQTAYTNAVKKVERLISMCANGIITEAELQAKKPEAMKEKERAQRALNETDKGITSWADKMENVLTFVAHARTKFKNGTKEERRKIFLSLGSNLLLKDRKVIFQSPESHQHIKKISSVVKEVIHPIEPVDKVANQGHIETLLSSSSMLCRVRESNPCQKVGNLLYYHCTNSAVPLV